MTINVLGYAAHSPKQSLEPFQFERRDHCQDVGVGCMVDSCQHCAPCDRGHEQYCENGATYTYNARDRHDQRPSYGGYSNKTVVSEKFVLKIPAGLNL